MDLDRDIAWITSELVAGTGERAPRHLRSEIDAMSKQARRPRPARRMLIPAGGLIVAVLVALGLVLGLSGQSPEGPTVAQAAAVGAQPISYSPPPAATATPGQTRRYARFAQVRFPPGLGPWNFEGWRIARLDGRRILTIYYAHGDDEISYSVAATPVLEGQRSGFATFALAGRTVVSWRESDHSCLLSSASLPRAMLLAIARS
jgi:hypothetical protein